MNRTRVNISFNKDKCLSQDTRTESEESYVVTKFMSGWIVRDGSELSLLYPPRLREMILFERLMSNHVLPAEKIDPVVVYPGVLTRDQASTLLSMFTNNKRCPPMITDRRLGHNGLTVGVYHTAGDTGHDQLDNVTLKLETRCSLIPYLGVDDLMEIIEKVSAGNTDSVGASRPARVREYLGEEATRLAADMPVTDMSSGAVEEMMETRMTVLGSRVTTCLHGRPMMKTLSCHQAINNDND